MDNQAINPDQPAPETIAPEIDPVLSINNLLTEAGHRNPTFWLHGVDGNALDTNVPIDLRRFLVNRRWRTILGLCDVNSIDARFCLVDTGPLSTWLKLFKESVLPFVLLHEIGEK